MDGREKCKLLKQIRAKIAADHGIEGFEYKKCTNKGYCSGTCPACDQEVAALEKILRDRGIDICVPNNPNMPQQLIGVMDDAAFKDMEYLLRHTPTAAIDYDKIPGGRVVNVRGEKAKKYYEEQRKIHKKHRFIGGAISLPRVDFEELEKDADEKERKIERQRKIDNSHIGKIRGLLKKKKDGDKK